MLLLRVSTSFDYAGARSVDEFLRKLIIAYNVVNGLPGGHRMNDCTFVALHINIQFHFYWAPQTLNGTQSGRDSNCINHSPFQFSVNNVQWTFIMYLFHRNAKTTARGLPSIHITHLNCTVSGTPDAASTKYDSFVVPLYFCFCFEWEMKQQQSSSENGTSAKMNIEIKLSCLQIARYLLHVLQTRDIERVCVCAFMWWGKHKVL